MDARAAHLVDALELEAHPEGGFYREVFRSPHTVRPEDGRPPRAGLTTIYFLLVDGGRSRWHRVASDEAWHFYEGAPLDLLVADAAAEAVEAHRLGPLAGGAAPVHVVPAGNWQAARTTGAYTLVGCTVGPGFDFEDFELLAPDAPLADALRRHDGAAAFL